MSARFMFLAFIVLLVGFAPGAAAFWLEPAALSPDHLYRSPQADSHEHAQEHGENSAGPARLDDWGRCAAHTAAAEEILGLPPHLLLSIAKAESGRVTPDRRAVSAWPWTVMAEGRGRYLPSREAAIAEVHNLQARGVRNIDVGCMQINLRWHPQAFESLEQAFDPAFNVAYGAVFLADLHDRLGSWTDAVGRYHSATPAYSARYRARVLELWDRERKSVSAPKRETEETARAETEEPEAADEPVSAPAAKAPRVAGAGAIGWR